MRAKPIPSVSRSDIAAVVQAVSNAYAAHLTSCGYVVQASDKGSINFSLAVALPDAPKTKIRVDVESVRAAGYGSVWARDVHYRGGARITVDTWSAMSDKQSKTWAFFGLDDAGKLDPSSKDAFTRLDVAIRAALVNRANDVAKMNHHAAVVAAVKGVLENGPLNKGVMEHGFGVLVNVHGGKPEIKLDCRPEDFADVWNAIRKLVHRQAGFCECGTPLAADHVGPRVCRGCLQGIVDRVCVQAAEALRVLPSHFGPVGE